MIIMPIFQESMRNVKQNKGGGPRAPSIVLMARNGLGTQGAQ